MIHGATYLRVCLPYHLSLLPHPSSTHSIETYSAYSTLYLTLAIYLIGTGPSGSTGPGQELTPGAGPTEGVPGSKGFLRSENVLRICIRNLLGTPLWPLQVL